MGRVVKRIDYSVDIWYNFMECIGAGVERKPTIPQSANADSSPSRGSQGQKRWLQAGGIVC